MEGRDEGGVEDEEYEHADCHAEEHVAGGGGADVDAVPDEGCNSADREEEGPREIDADGADDVGIACEFAHEPRTEEEIEEGEEYSHGASPDEETAHYILIDDAVLGTDSLACKCFASKGKSIHEVRIESEELHEQGVDCQFSVTLFCSRRYEEEMYSDEAESAEENVLVDIEK